MNNNIISICIANYNKGPLVKFCLDSIRKHENIHDLEVIVVDDCSTDNSREIITKWIKDNKDITTILSTNKKNSGPGTTYNNAIKLAKGEFISIIDSDDFFIQSSLDIKRNIFKKQPDLKIVYGNGTYVDGDQITGGSVNKNTFNLFKKLNYEPKKILENIYSKIPLLLVNSVLIRTDFLKKIGGFDESCFQNDRLLNIKIFQNIKNKNEFTIYDKLAFGYRIYENNISKNFDNTLKVVNQVIEKYCPMQSQKNAYANSYFINALSNLSIGKSKKAFLSMKKSIQFHFEIKKILLFTLAFIFPSRFLLKIIPKKIFHNIKSLIMKYFQ